MNNDTPAIVFSVYRRDVSKANNEAAANHIRRVLHFHGIPFFDALGFYKGFLEQSFVLQDVAGNLKTVRQSAQFYEQDSILLIDSKRRARLETPAGDLIGALGEFRRVTKTAAFNRDAWTLCNGSYWIAG